LLRNALSVRVFLCGAVAEDKNVSRTLTENMKPLHA
jgi:hypothetical protein